MRADHSLIRALQEIRSWNVEDMHVPGFAVYGNEFGLTSFLVSNRLRNVRGSRWS